VLDHLARRAAVPSPCSRKGDQPKGLWGEACHADASHHAMQRRRAKLVDRVVFAKSRDELVAATKALDRVLLWNNYIVPHWSNGKVRAARWDRFSHPDKLPEYGASAFPIVWWWDAAKAAKTGSRQ